MKIFKNKKENLNEVTIWQLFIENMKKQNHKPKVRVDINN